MAKATKTVAATSGNDTLTNLQIARANVLAKAASGLGVTQHTSGAVIKGLAPQAVLAKPNANSLQYISAIKGHPCQGSASGACIKRWHKYAVGDTLLHARITNGLTPNDITYWAKCGYLTLSPASPAQIAHVQAQWASGYFAHDNVMAGKASAQFNVNETVTSAKPSKAA